MPALPEDAVALVTGAGSGIGRALATELSRRGARLILVGRREEALERTREGFAGNREDRIVAADVTAPAGRARIVAAAGDIGRLDLLVNNAGAIAVAPAGGTNDTEVERMLATNVAAPFALTRDLLPLLRRSATPRIVNVGSMFGDIAFPHFAAYSATKFALRGLSDALRRELAPDGIGVTYAAPRAVRTDSTPAFAHLVEPLRMALDEPEKVARRIVDAAAAGQRSVYPRGPERLFVLIARLFPAVVDRSVIAQMRRVEEVREDGRPAPAPSRR